MTKRMISTFALLVLASFAAFAGKAESTPEAAALATSEVQSYSANGFTLGEVRTEQVLYKIEPTGNYLWGQVSVFLNKAEPLLLKTTTAIVTAEVEHVQRGDKEAYRVISVSVVERVMY